MNNHPIGGPCRLCGRPNIEHGNGQCPSATMTIDTKPPRSYIVAASTKDVPKTGLVRVTKVTVETDFMAMGESMRIDLADDPLYKDLQGYVLGNPR